MGVKSLALVWNVQSFLILEVCTYISFSLYRTAFFFFSNKRRPKLKKEHPDLKVGPLAKLLGQEWSEMSDKEKKPFAEQATKDKERYEFEMDLWRKGKFSREDPSKEEDDEEEDDDEDEEDYSDAED